MLQEQDAAQASWANLVRRIHSVAVWQRFTVSSFILHLSLLHELAAVVEHDEDASLRYLLVLLALYHEALHAHLAGRSR